MKKEKILEIITEISDYNETAILALEGNGADGSASIATVLKQNRRNINKLVAAFTEMELTD